MTAAIRDPRTGRFTRTVPAVVVAGGLRWTAAEHGGPWGSPIGWDLACRRGTPVPAGRVDLVKAGQP